MYQEKQPQDVEEPEVPLRGEWGESTGTCGVQSAQFKGGRYRPWPLRRLCFEPGPPCGPVKPSQPLARSLGDRGAQPDGWSGCSQDKVLACAMPKGLMYMEATIPMGESLHTRFYKLLGFEQCQDLSRELNPGLMGSRRSCAMQAGWQMSLWPVGLRMKRNPKGTRLSLGPGK